MSQFNLTANINAQLNNSSVRTEANKLRERLRVTAKVDLKIANNKKSVRGLIGDLGLLNKELKLVDSNSKSARNTIDSLQRSFKKLSDSITPITAVKRQIQAVSQSGKAAKISIDGLGNSLNGLKSNTTITTRLGKSVKEAGQAAEKSGSQLEELGKQTGLALRRFVGFRLISSVFSTFSSVVSSSVGEAISFEKELIKISQVSGRTTKTLGSLTDEITKLSTGLGVSSGDLIGISRILTQAGLSANETELALGALAKSTLAPTFTNIENTAEGAIAIFKQFGIQAGELESALGAINAVSGKFAVESDDIIAAVKRAGGVFASTSEGVSEGIDALNEFIAVFTSVRATTRESAEGIATGLRTIFTRIQRPATITFLKDLGVNLTDVEGKFVGPFKAITEISNALGDLSARDPKFSKLVEELGGFRQVGKVIPLLTQQEERINALQVAQQGLNSLNKDSEIAQQSLANQIAKTREEFISLIREISGTDTFKTLVEGTLSLTRGLINLADSVKPILPLLGAIGLIKGFSGIAQFSKGFGAKFLSRNEGGEVLGLASGGLVPGGRGIKDDFDTTLPSGAYVIKRKAVDAIGRENLENLSRRKFSGGGQVPVSLTRGEFIIDPETARGLGPETLNILNNAEKIKGLREGGFVDDEDLREFLKGRQKGKTLNQINQGKQSLPKNTFINVSQAPSLRSSGPTLGRSGPKLGQRSGPVLGQSSGNSLPPINDFDHSFIPKDVITKSRLEGILKEVETKRESKSSSFANNVKSRISGLSEKIGARGAGRTTRRATLAAGGRRLARNLSPGLATGAIIAGSQVGGSLGSALSGAGTGALLGSSIAPGIGTAVGAVGGAALSFATSSIEEDQARVLETASKSIQESMERAEKAMVSLGKNGNIDEALKIAAFSLDSIILSSKSLDKQSNDGIGSRVVNFLAGTGSLFNETSSDRRSENKDNTKRNNRIGEQVVVAEAAIAGAIAGQTFIPIPVVGAAIGATIGGGAAIASGAFNSPENFVTKEEIRASVRTQNAADLQKGNQAKQENKTGIDAVNRIVTQLIKEGKSTEQILNKLGTEGSTLFALGQANVGELQALGSQSGDKRALGITGKTQAREDIVAFKKQTDTQNKLNEAFANSNVQIVKFTENINQAMSEIERAGSAGEGFARNNAALTGNGIRSSARQNVFKNPSAFSAQEIGLASTQIVGTLGGDDQGFSGDLLRNINGLKDLEKRLPQVLANVSGGTEDQSEELAVSDAITKNFSNLPEHVLDNLVASINASTGNRQGGSVKDFAQDKAANLARKELSKTTELFNKAQQVTNKAITDYESAVGKWIGLQKKANSDFDQASGRNIQSRNQITSLDRNLTFEELTKGTTSQINRGAGRSGAQNGSLSGILDRLRGIDSQRLNLNRQSENFRTTGQGDPKLLADKFAILAAQQNDAESVLRLIATNTQISAAANQKLIEIENSKKTSQQLAEEFVSADPSQKFQLNREIQLARATRDGAQFSGQSAGQALRGERRLTGLEGGTSREADLRIRQTLSRRSDVQGLFRQGGRTAENALIQSPEERRFRGILDQNAQGQLLAGNALGQRSQNKADEFSNNAVDRFNTVLDSLDKVLREKIDVPQLVQIGGRIDVAVVVTGAEVLASLPVEIGKIVDSKVAEALRRNIDPTNGLDNLANA